MIRTRVAVMGALLSACIFTGPRKQYAPPAAAAKAETGATAAILRDVPAGADLLIEIDLERLYGNSTIGAIAHRALARPADELRVPGLVLPRGQAPLEHARALVMAAYAVGTADAVTATYVVTQDEVPGATSLGDGVVVLAPPAFVDRARLVMAGASDAIARDAAFMSLRARAMPAGAPGSTVRATARLGLDARVALAPVLGPDLAPATLSLWLDVVDDAAVVAIVDGHDAAGGGGERLQIALERVRIALAGSTTLLQLGLAPVVRGAQLSRRGDVVTLIATIGPHRLGEVASRLSAANSVAAPQPASYPPAP